MGFFDHEISVPVHGDPDRAFEMARGVLASTNFDVQPSTEEDLKAACTYRWDATLNTITSFSRLTFRVRGGQLHARGKLGNLWVSFLVQQGLIGAAILPQHFMLDRYSIWFVLVIVLGVPLIVLLITRPRAVRELETLVRNMALATAS